MGSATTTREIQMCPVCGKGLLGGFAFLEGGAVFLAEGDASDLQKEVEGYLVVGYHGSNGENSAAIEIIEEGKYGQFELVFCSVSCLRSFVSGRIDELEEKLQRG